VLTPEEWAEVRASQGEVARGEWVRWDDVRPPGMRSTPTTEPAVIMSVLPLRPLLAWIATSKPSVVIPLVGTTSSRSRGLLGSIAPVLAVYA
jgi:hypothetical protein